MGSLTFEWQGATFTFTPELTAGQQLDVDLIVDTLRGESTGTRHTYRRVVFAEFLASITHIEGEPPFPLPAFDAPVAELQAAYDAFIASVGLLPAWRAARRSKKNG